VGAQVDMLLSDGEVHCNHRTLQLLCTANEDTPARSFTELQPRAASTRACALAITAAAELCGRYPPLALPYWLGIAGGVGHVLRCQADT